MAERSMTHPDIPGHDVCVPLSVIFDGSPNRLTQVASSFMKVNCMAVYAF